MSFTDTYPPPDLVCWQVVPNTMFRTANVVFVPGQTFYVTDTIYNSTLTDGSTFQSRCASAFPRTSWP